MELKKILEIILLALLVAVTIMIIGASSGLSWYFLTVSESDQIHQNLKMMATEARNAIEKDISLEIKGLQSMKAFYEGSSFVDFQEYQLFDEFAPVASEDSPLNWYQLVTNDTIDAYITRYKGTVNKGDLDIMTIKEDGSVGIRKKDASYYLPLSYTLPKENMDSTAYNTIGLDYMKNYFAKCREAMWTTMQTNNYTYCSNASTLHFYISIDKGALSNSVALQNGVLQKTIKLEKLKWPLGWHISVGIEHEELLSVGGIHKNFVQPKYEMTFDVKSIPLTITFQPSNELYSSYQTPIRIIVLILTIIVPLVLLGLILSGRFCLRYQNVLVSSAKREKEIVLVKKIADAIAFLDLDNEDIQDIEYKESKTNLEEVLCKIVSNIRSYQPFLPKSLFVSDEDEILDEDSDDDSDKQSDNTFHGVSSSSTSSSRPMKITPISYYESSKGSSKKKNIKKGLRSREVTIMLLKVNGLMKIRSPTLLSEFHTQYLELMVEAVTSKGDFHGCHDDQLLFSWNAVSSRHNPENYGCEAALKCYENFLKLQNAYCDSIPDLKLSVSVCSGTVLCGNVGSKNSKSFCIYGSLLPTCRKLSFLNQVLDTSLLVDQKTYQNTKQTYIYKIADNVDPLKNGRPFLVRELKDKKELSLVYSIEDNSTEKHFEQYNIAWKKFLGAEAENALTILEKLQQTKEIERLKKLILHEKLPYVHQGSIF